LRDGAASRRLDAPAIVGGSSDHRGMDLFDFTDYLPLLSRRVRDAIVVAVAVGVVFVPPVREWFAGQLMQHAGDVSRKFREAIQPAVPAIDPKQQVRPSRQGAG
jgi:hypothetical protein